MTHTPLADQDVFVHLRSYLFDLDAEGSPEAARLRLALGAFALDPSSPHRYIDQARRVSIVAEAAEDAARDGNAELAERLRSLVQPFRTGEREP